MEFRPLHVLLTAAFILTTQALVKVSVSPVVTAECGQQVSLHCNVSSTRDGLSINHLAWIQNDKPLCGLGSDGNITEHHRHTLSGFHCRYEREQGRLSLVFQKVQPLESGHSTRYMCKLRSNQGVAEEHTTVELQECGGSVDAAVTPEGPTCTFRGVHPDGDVHWFHGSTRLAEGSPRINTSKRVDAGGWLTVTSSLEKNDYKEPYNCSLWNPASGRYISSSLVQIPGQHRVIWSGAGAPGPLWTFWCFPFLAVFSMK
ncbi:basal cell adhesion molecule-like [Centroberyx affinis]|uniref:basal cell adhesion molecule-like n=1 Tax=Centroberyx affinis TaxID=166261 RepID=UPI003A5BE8A9